MQAPSITLPFADGEYAFALRIGELRELEAKAACGIGALYRRLASGDFYAEDAGHIVRLGLIGGGASPAEALRLTNSYVLERPLAESVPLAMAILMARLFREEGKAKAPGEAETPRAE